jgi:hypothetical protein
MKKIIYTLLVLAASSQIQAQVGIGTDTPNNSAMLDVQSTERGILFPRMTSAERSAITAPANGLHVFDTNTNSLWYFNGSFWVNSKSEATEGDVKSGIQPNDHAGWVLLDGRPLNALSANQQAVAASLGLTGNLPNANNTYLSQNGAPIATVSGSNTTTLTQDNLPNVSFTGTTNSSGEHNHSGSTGNAGSHSHTGTTDGGGSHAHSGTTDGAGAHSHSHNANGGQGGFGLVHSNGFATATSTDNSQGELNLWRNPDALNINAVGNHSHSFTTNTVPNHNHTFTTTTNGAHTHTISTDGAHTHTVTVSSGGSASPINIAPQTLSVNMFIYLGL